jgi:hypothetical protein
MSLKPTLIRKKGVESNLKVIEALGSLCTDKFAHARVVSDSTYHLVQFKISWVSTTRLKTIPSNIQKCRILRHFWFVTKSSKPKYSGMMIIMVHVPLIFFKQIVLFVKKSLCLLKLSNISSKK